jgi:hypothetical protein
VSVCQLSLCPAIPESPRVALDILETRLQAIGLIGPAFACGTTTGYAVGERFLQLVTFLGCSPAIELDPPADASARTAACESGRLCHVRLSQTRNGLSFRADVRMPAPRCPKCRRPLPDWDVRLANWRRDPARSDWSCAACGHRGRLYELNFRKAGGFGHTFIEIWGIYPSEAVPGAALLEVLRELSGGDWKTLYICRR